MVSQTESGERVKRERSEAKANSATAPATVSGERFWITPRSNNGKAQKSKDPQVRRPAIDHPIWLRGAA